MVHGPTTISDIDKLIKDEVQEDLHLEYKQSLALNKSKGNEIAKDVSAFANSDGGVLIYGIVEENKLPVRNDGGVDHTVYSREWLEQIMSSRITPRVDDIHIIPILISGDRSIYVVEIPKSNRGPHQSSDNKYYKRHNFHSVPMEDYEINDVRNRRRIVPPLVNIDIQNRRMMTYLTIANVGEQTAEDIRFDLPNELLPWIKKQQARIFINGIKYLPPRREFRFRYGLLNALVHEISVLPSRFDITVTYRHPDLENRISDCFHIDLNDYWGASLLESEVYYQSKEIKELVKGLSEELRTLNGHISKMTTIAGPTGLDVSVSTFRNLNHVLAGDNQFDKLNPIYLDYDVFMEVLGVEIETAYRLSDFFRSGNETNGLNELEGVTEEIIEKIKKHFDLADTE